MDEWVGVSMNIIGQFICLSKRYYLVRIYQHLRALGGERGWGTTLRIYLGCMILMHRCSCELLSFPTDWVVFLAGRERERVKRFERWLCEEQ